MKKYNFCPECGTSMKDFNLQRQHVHQATRRRRNLSMQRYSFLWVPNIFGIIGEKGMRFNSSANLHFFPTYPKLFMAKKVDDIRIAKFHEDRELLAHYNDTDIAKKMQMDKSSYSSYNKGRYPITNNFLNKFYRTFGREINEILEKRNQASVADDKNYKRPDDIEEQSQKIKDLETKLEKLASSHQLISMEIHRLDQKLDSILENRLDKIEALLLSIAGKKPDSGGPGENGKENSAVQKKAKKHKLSKESPGEEESSK